MSEIVNFAATGEAWLLQPNNDKVSTFIPDWRSYGEDSRTGAFFKIFSISRGRETVGLPRNEDVRILAAEIMLAYLEELPGAGCGLRCGGCAPLNIRVVVLRQPVRWKHTVRCLIPASPVVFTIVEGQTDQIRCWSARGSTGCKTYPTVHVEA